MNQSWLNLKVSIIIPTYNRAHFIGDAIETALSQTYRPIEIIVVNDGSTDNTEDVLRKYAPDIQVITQPNAGPPSARNRGLEYATGNVIAFLDSDDLWPTDKLVHQVGLLSNPAVDIVLGCLQYCEFTDGKSGILDMKAISDLQLGYNLGAAVIRRSAFERVGVFDEQFRFSDDWDWFVRAKEAGLSIVKTQKVTLYNRRHSGNLSNQREIGDHYTIKMLKKTLDRRRNQPEDK